MLPVGLWGAGCGSKETRSTRAPGSLPADAVARVGDTVIDREALAAQMAATGTSAREALTALEDMELLEQEARRRAIDMKSIERAERRARVNALLDAIEAELPASAVDEATVREELGRIRAGGDAEPAAEEVRLALVQRERLRRLTELVGEASAATIVEPNTSVVEQLPQLPLRLGEEATTSVVPLSSSPPTP